MKSIAVCLDGTGNEYGEANTNVLKLYSMLVRDEARQVVLYDPGVGTFSAPAALTAVARAATRVLGLAFGYGITHNVATAYRFLMATYEPGDRVFLFGFSRGAYAARAVAGLLHKCGLLVPRHETLVPYALKLFKYERRAEIAEGFARTFSRPCPVHFLGVWDTVKSVGWIYDPLTLPYTMRNPSVSVVRQALALDERRCFYRQNLWGEPFPGQDVRQVWFAGAHCDVGGSYPERESGLAQVALQWMAGEAGAHGLLLDPARRAALLPASPTAAGPVPPDPHGPIHRSLSGSWWIPEFVPRLYEDPRRDFAPRLKIPAGERRFVPEGALVHRSVAERLSQGYRPPNLPARYEVT